MDLIFYIQTIKIVSIKIKQENNQSKCISLTITLNKFVLVRVNFQNICFHVNRSVLVLKSLLNYSLTNKQL